jgi:hypothetical protein
LPITFIAGQIAQADQRTEEILLVGKVADDRTAFTMVPLDGVLCFDMDAVGKQGRVPAAPAIAAPCQHVVGKFDDGPARRRKLASVVFRFGLLGPNRR